VTGSIAILSVTTELLVSRAKDLKKLSVVSFCS